EIRAELALLKPEEDGERIGNYKLLQQIGEGGFGVVWMAQQIEPVQRRVALKIIKLGMDTKEVIARFEQERQALAMMDDPNIAKVFDAGTTPTGRPFFVMELVKGMPITKYCDEAGLGTRERLVLFGDVCSAINHAHQKGVIHRDIKPSNVMVTLHGDKPVVKVIDFGIAKATQGKLTDKTIFTRFEQFIGTPVYMSPEQASMSGLDVDTRSDIYALGILLYELLTGKPPFDAKSLASAGYEEMRRIIREVEPPKPSSRLSTVAGEERFTLAKARRIDPGKVSRMVEPDLDWIVMKAIEKDRARRYETANAFAKDIKRFLADEPVSASPPSFGYKAGKFVRKYRRGVIAAAAVLLALLAGLVASTVLYLGKSDALTSESVQRHKAEAARLEAEAVTTFLMEVFRSSEPGRVGRTITVADSLDRAARKLDSDLAGQPEQRVPLQATLGMTYLGLGLHREAIPLLEKSRDYYLATRGVEHHNTIGAMGGLAAAYFVAGRGEEALKLREEALQLRRKVSGPEHPETLMAMSNLAVSYYSVDRRDEALKLSEEGLVLRRKVSGPEHPGTLAAMNNLAVSYNNGGRREEAIRLHEEVLALSRKVNGPEHPTTTLMMGNLANSYADAGRRDQALKLREQTLASARKVSGPEHPNTMLAMGYMAASYKDADRRDEAFELFKELLALCRKVSGPEHPDTLIAISYVAISYADAGRWDEALKLFEELLTLRCEVSGADHPETLLAGEAVAKSYREANRLPEAEKLVDALLASLDETSQSHEYAAALRQRGKLRVQMRRWKEAAADYARAAKLNPGDHMVWYRLAPLLLHVGDAGGYRKHRQALPEEIRTTDDVTIMERTAKACLLLPVEGEELAAAGKLADAAATLGKQHKFRSSFQFTKGLAQYRRGQFHDAVSTLRDLLADSVSGALEIHAHTVMAMASHRLDQPAEARASLAKASDLVASKLPSPDSGDFDDFDGTDWSDTLIAHLLLHEAEALVQVSDKK
ncbi:MAG: serine/threonine-protein kinase, partial [Tepidisphaeraceae bacterium]